MTSTLLLAGLAVSFFGYAYYSSYRHDKRMARFNKPKKAVSKKPVNDQA